MSAATVLIFEHKIQGLFDYYNALEALDPQNPDHNQIANPDFFDNAYHNATKPLQEVKAGVLHDIGSHAVRQYGHLHGRGLDLIDLREDTGKLRRERAGILALQTGPTTPEVRQERAGHIASLLADISRGKTLTATWHGSAFHRRILPQEVTFDATSPVFGVFEKDLVSDPLTIHYRTPGTPRSFAREEQVAMRISLSALFTPVPTGRFLLEIAS